MQGKWVETPYIFPVSALEQAVSFNMGNAWYTGLGFYDEDQEQKLFFRFTPDHGWEIIKEFPGKSRLEATAFVLDNKAYVGLGRPLHSGPREEFYKDFWVYDPLFNTWDSLKTGFPGEGLIGAVAFAAHGRAYVGTGQTKDQAVGDFYEYLPETGWSKKEELTVNPRSFATVFAANGEHYLCFGGNAGAYSRDVKKFSFSPLSWVAMQSLKYEDKPDMTRAGAVAVVMNEEGRDYVYVIGGNPDVWCCRYDPLEDSWEEVADFARLNTYFMVGQNLYSINGITTYRFERDK